MLLDIRNLSVSFSDGSGTAHAVRNASLGLDSNEILAVVGESGAGKTSLGLAVLNLLPRQARVSGQVLLEGRDVLVMKGNELRQLRGRDVSMIFQDPGAGLNPVLSIGQQVGEVLVNHLGISRKEARQQSVAVLQRMGVRDAERLVDDYPFKLSGGMAQRVMIAIAMALQPRLLIADEPTSSLDVTVQAQILAELRRLRDQFGTAILLITHDLGVVAQMADRVAVMYAGHVVEQGTAREIFADPAHPYTEGLLATRPRLDGAEAGRLRAIRGGHGDDYDTGELCPFLPRCHKALVVCRTEPMPPLVTVEERHPAACYNPVRL